MAASDAIHADKDIREAVRLLPDSDALLGKSIEVLIDFATIRGMEHVGDMIEQSPSAELLLPLMVALDKEMGKEPRVAREVDEIAEDIRNDLARRRDAIGTSDAPMNRS